MNNLNDPQVTKIIKELIEKDYVEEVKRLGDITKSLVENTKFLKDNIYNVVQKQCEEEIKKVEKFGKIEYKDGMIRLLDVKEKNMGDAQKVVEDFNKCYDKHSLDYNKVSDDFQKDMYEINNDYYNCILKVKREDEKSLKSQLNDCMKKYFKNYTSLVETALRKNDRLNNLL